MGLGSMATTSMARVSRWGRSDEHEFAAISAGEAVSCPKREQLVTLDACLVCPHFLEIRSLSEFGGAPRSVVCQN